MKNSEIKVGDKVVPTRKTVGCRFKSSTEMAKAKEKGQPFLYVACWDKQENCWILSNEEDFRQGDFFKAKDFVEYVG